MLARRRIPHVLGTEETAAELRTLQGNAADDRRRLGRVYGVLGMAAGLFLVILLA